MGRTEIDRAGSVWEIDVSGQRKIGAGLQETIMKESQ